MSRDQEQMQILQDFKSCTGIEDVEKAEEYLDNAHWDLLKAIELATPHDSQKLPSEVIIDDVPMPDVSHLPSGSSNLMSVSDDYYSAPSTSKSSIKFDIYNINLDCSHSITLSENDTVRHLKTAIRQQWGVPECKQQIRGWTNDTPANNDVKLKSLNLPPSVQLSVYMDDFVNDSKKTVNGIKGKPAVDDDGHYMLHIFDEVHSKEYKIPVAASKRVLDVKTDMYACSDIPVNQQIWAGWPNSQTNDDLTLGTLGLTVPVHELSFRAAPVLVPSGQPKKRNSRVSSIDSDDSDTYSSNEDEDMQSVIADDLFEEDFSAKNCSCSLVPPDFENETMGSIQFAVSFQEKYGVAHPDFFPGTLDQAFKEACFRPAKDKKLLAVYLHHHKSVLTNVFCSQLLCVESVLQYLKEHFIVWGWDVTLENNKSFLCHTIQTVIDREAAYTVRSTKTEKYPLIFIITRVRRNTEILAIIHGNVVVNELMSELMQAVDLFTEQQIVESKEEEERTAREMIKVEQDQAYQQSLEVDRAKLEAKRKQEQMELEEQAKIERARQKEAEKKEAHRRVLESKLPPEPSDGTEGITKIRVRVHQNQFLERKFLKTDTLQLLLDYLVVRGYDTAEYKLITSFPRRDVGAILHFLLTTLSNSSTFEELHLYPQETLILEER